MRLTDAAERVFARHETFHPRYGWFRKAYIAAADDPLVFTLPDAPVRLGVGKNMVRAIRFWGLAAKVIVEDPQPENPRKPGVIPTRMGHALFGELGWDPFMEDPGTLWLLHWRLLAPPSRLPVWWLAFNEFGAVEFSERQLTDAISLSLEASIWDTPHNSSIRKDVSALLRTYAPTKRSRRGSIDDLLDCPLRELSLIRRGAAVSDGFRFAVGVKDSLPSAVVVHAALDWIARIHSGGNTVTLSRLARDPGSVGQAFKLNEQELLAALEPAAAEIDGIALAAPTGAVQLSWSLPPALVAVQALQSYYETEAADASDELCAGHDGDGPIDDSLLSELGLGRDPHDTLRRLHERGNSGSGAAQTEGNRLASTSAAGIGN